jgi:hypothetical protein
MTQPAAPYASRAVAFAGVMLGTALVVLVYWQGARPRIPGMPAFLGIAVGALVVWLVVVLIASVGAELLRRNRKALAGHAMRHGRRGASAVASVTRKGSKSAASRLSAWAGPRWAARARLDRREAERRQRLGTGQLAATVTAATGTHDPASAPAPAAASQNGTTMTNRPAGMTDTQSGPAIGWVRDGNRSRINPDRRAHRAAASSGGKVPSEWGPVVAAAADFEPESDEHLINWMNDQVAGMASYAEALIEAYETGVNAVGIDPKGLAALHDVADAAAHAAEMMHGAKGKFADHYELPREFAANGGQMTHDGRWVTGEGG